MKSFRDLQVWEKAHQLTLDLYRETRTFPVEEKYGLSSQLRRAAVSIESNIAEGCGRRGNGEFHKFLQNATGSANEVECQLLIAHDLGMIANPAFEQMTGRLTEVRKMLTGLIKRVEQERLRD
jgi:four helix bundle protein